MEINARLLSSLPLCWDGSVDISLMNDLRDELCSILDQIRAWSWDLRPGNSICSAIFEEETDEGAESVQEQPYDDEVDHKKDNRPLTHLGGSRR